MIEHLNKSTANDSNHVVNSLTSSNTEFCLGVLLAVFASVLHGCSFVIIKKALLKTSLKGGVSAGAGGYAYFKQRLWWAGFITGYLGDNIYFYALALAPASVIAPLGGLAVLVSTVLSTFYLEEKLNLTGKLGCFLCIVGSTVVVIHAPKSVEIDSMSFLIDNLVSPEFLAYTAVECICFLTIALYFAPRYGHKNIFVYLIQDGIANSFTAVFAKGLGIALKNTVSGKSSELFEWTTVFFLAVIGISMILHLNYLNKSLDLYNTAIVMPVSFVTFTSFVIVATSILYKEWEGMSYEDVLGCLSGFLIVVLALFLLLTFGELHVSRADIRNSVIKPKKMEINI